MMKFFVLAALIGVSMAAETKETCAAGIVTGGGVACAECDDTSSTACKTLLAALPPTEQVISCVALVECFKSVDEATAKKVADAATKAADDAAKAMADKYGKYCPTDKAQCADRDGYCPTWAAATPNQCTENPEWMLQNCMNSCCPICTGKNTLDAGACPLEDRSDLCVLNTESSCAKWAMDGECDANPDWMKVNCMQSCCPTCKVAADGCPTVKDTCANFYATPDATEGSEKCAEWSKAGECTANPVWMKQNCAKDCCSICQPIAPARANNFIYQQPFQQSYYQQPFQVQQPRQVLQQPRQVFQQPRQVQFGGYQNAPGLLQRGLPYTGR